MTMDDKKYLSAEKLLIEKERGGCLTVWLAFFLVFNGFFLYSYIRQSVWLAAAWSLFGMVCVIGVWNWQRLAYWGLLLGFAFNVALNIDAQSLLGVMYNLTFLGLTYFLVNPKMEYFK